MMSHSSVREDVAQRKSMNECSRNKVNFSGFPCSGKREQWTLCREQWTLCREQWTLCREQWPLCREQWTLCREQWTLCREQWTPCGEQWTPCREQWTLCREQWTLCREQWTLCREQWTLCREQWTLCREQWTLCREHVNRNTVHARSALLTSWLSESGVLTKRDMQNMQSGGARGLELRTSGLGRCVQIYRAPFLYLPGAPIH